MVFGRAQKGVSQSEFSLRGAVLVLGLGLVVPAKEETTDPPFDAISQVSQRDDPSYAEEWLNGRWRPGLRAVCHVTEVRDPLQESDRSGGEQSTPQKYEPQTVSGIKGQQSNDEREKKALALLIRMSLRSTNIVHV